MENISIYRIERITKLPHEGVILFIITITRYNIAKRYIGSIDMFKYQNLAIDMWKSLIFRCIDYAVFSMLIKQQYI